MACSSGIPNSARADLCRCTPRPGKGSIAIWPVEGSSAATTAPVFISMWGTRLAYRTVNAVFLELIRSIGLRGGPGTPGPCIHDLRHTFAVRSLEACHGGKEEIARHMLALSTYLGHAHPSDTYYYLQATPKLMEEIGS